VSAQQMQTTGTLPQQMLAKLILHAIEMATTLVPRAPIATTTITNIFQAHSKVRFEQYVNCFAGILVVLTKLFCSI
jgi:hypothetical protein